MILITGGAGYIGSHVNKALNKAGYETVVLDNLIKGFEDFVKWGVFVEGDYGDEELLNKIFKEYEAGSERGYSFQSAPGRTDTAGYYRAISGEISWIYQYEYGDTASGRTWDVELYSSDSRRKVADNNHCAAGIW